MALKAEAERGCNPFDRSNSGGQWFVIVQRGSSLASGNYEAGFGRNQD